MDKSVQLVRFKITPPNDVLLTDSHQHEQGSLFIKKWFAYYIINFKQNFQMFVKNLTTKLLITSLYFLKTLSFICDDEPYTILTNNLKIVNNEFLTGDLPIMNN